MYTSYFVSSLTYPATAPLSFLYLSLFLHCIPFFCLQDQSSANSVFHIATTAGGACLPSAMLVCCERPSPGSSGV